MGGQAGRGAPRDPPPGVGKKKPGPTLAGLWITIGTAAGERISMPPMVGILFEVQDLAVASPATVSRCGMVYFDYPDLGMQR